MKNHPTHGVLVFARIHIESEVGEGLFLFLFHARISFFIPCEKGLLWALKPHTVAESRFKLPKFISVIKVNSTRGKVTERGS